MEPIIPTYDEISKELNSEISESQILNSPIMENLEMKYTINDLIDVWVRGCTNGATMWQFCQDYNKPLPSSFEYGIKLLQEEVNKTEDKSIALHELMSSNMILLGLFQELLDKDTK